MSLSQSIVAVSRSPVYIARIVAKVRTIWFINYDVRMNQLGHSLTRLSLLVNHCAFYGDMCRFLASNGELVSPSFADCRCWEFSERADPSCLKAPTRAAAPL